MFPWLAAGHQIPYLHLSNKLAERGHRVSFLLPTKPMAKFAHLNLHPHLITFFPVTVPHLDGLPPDAQTMSDVPQYLIHLLMTAFKAMQDQVGAVLRNLNPDFVFFDLAYWIPAEVRPLSIKCINYNVVSATSVAYLVGMVPKLQKEENFTLEELKTPPSSFPVSSFQLHLHETQTLVDACKEFIKGLSYHEILTTSLRESDAISFRTCREIEGFFCDYLMNHFGKPVFVSGPILPKPPTTPLEDKWAKWLANFETGSVIFCAFGSELIMGKDQFQELVLGFELTGLPFFVALKSPHGVPTIEEALPEGFKERVGEKGVVHGDWVQQLLILNHPSIGCFVSHCGCGSMWESLASDAQVVVVPHLGDQVINARLMTRELKVAVEVEKREEDGWFTRESVCKAVKMVMDKESQTGKEVRANHASHKRYLLSDNFESSYIDSFVHNLQHLILQGDVN